MTDNNNMQNDNKDNVTPKKKSFAEMTDIEKEHYKKRRDMLIKKKAQELNNIKSQEEKDKAFSEIYTPPVRIEPTTASEKAHNFWYHYKFMFIVISIGVIMGAIFIYDMLTRVEHDHDIMFIGSYQFPTEYTQQVEDGIEVIGSDINSDGDIEVLFQSQSITSSIDYDAEMVAIGQATFTAAITEGENYIFITDEYSYSFLHSEEVELYDLSEISDSPNIEGDRYKLTDNPIFEDMSTDNNELFLVIRAPEGVYTADEEVVAEKFAEQIELVEKIINLE